MRVGDMTRRLLINGWLLTVLALYLSHRVFGGALFDRVRHAIWP